MQNFRDITATLEQAGALTRVTEDSLAAALTAALLHPENGQRASAVVEANSGATGQTLAALLALLEPRS
jgi:3-deoxy-D-manno-octulosonic-acid transferase